MTTLITNNFDLSSRVIYHEKLSNICGKAGSLYFILYGKRRKIMKSEKLSTPSSFALFRKILGVQKYQSC